MELTQEQLKKIAPKLQITLNELNELFKKYEINTPNRIAGFFAQCGHESIDFTARSENLNYSLNGLCRVFKKYFPDENSAKPYARNPERIANKVYANRMENGNEASGDGYRYRGRGYIQLTGKANYKAFAKAIGKDLEDAVAYCETDRGALESALYFWGRENINQLCGKDDIVAMTKRINGGVNGLDDRKERYENIKKALA